MRIETIGDATLYLGDTREILPALGRVDGVVTDPPYGIGANAMTLGNGKVPIDRGDAEWDASPPSASIFSVLMTNSKYQIFWGGNYYSLPPSRCWLVWDKCTGANDFADCELAWTNLDGVVKKKTIPWVGANARDAGTDRVHPTQKPLELMKWCIGLLPSNCPSILDPYMGSGTTGAAAIQMGHKFIGIEIEPRYFDLACRRVEDASKRPDMFVELDKRAAKVLDQLQRPTFLSIWDEPYKDAAE